MLRLGRRSRSGASLFALLALVQCGGSDLTLPSETGPSDLAVIDGDNQPGSAGEALPNPLIVRVTDRRGVPVRGQQVAFTLVDAAPGAAVKPDTATTLNDGRAEAQWTLGRTIGVQRVVANVVGFEDLAVTFQARVGSRAAVRIEQFGGDGQSAPVGTSLEQPLVVRVLDEFDNPVSGVTVDWEAEEGSVDPASVTTGDDGLAAAFWTLGSSTGDQTATATSSGLNGSPVTFTGHATPGSATRLTRVSGDNQTGTPGAQLSDPLVVRLADSEGNGVPDRPVSWVVGVGGGSVEPSTSRTDERGEARTRWTLGAAGTNTLNAVVSGVGVITFTATARSSQGGGGGDAGGGGGGEAPGPDHLEFLVQPSDSKEHRTIQPPVEVAVLDRDGKRVTNGSVEVKLELRGGKGDRLKGDKSRRTDAGVATFSDLRIDKEGNYRLSASADGLPSVESERFEVHDD